MRVNLAGAAHRVENTSALHAVDSSRSNPCSLLIIVRLPVTNFARCDNDCYSERCFIASGGPTLQLITSTPFQLLDYQVPVREVEYLNAAVLLDPLQRALGTIQALHLLCY